jgi:hypothetical protein
VLRAWVLCRLRQSWSRGVLLVKRRLASLSVAVLGWIFVALFASGSSLNAQGLSSVSSNMPGAGSAATSAAAPSTVSGVVKNAVTGAPVPRALVRLNDRAVLTDHDGNFRFDQNTSSSANVMVNKPGYYPGIEMQDTENLYLQGAQLGVPLELRLYPEAILTGTVLGPDGIPLPRISVNAQRKYFDEMGHRWMQMGQDQTDSHGNFRIPVQAGEYRIQTHYTPLDRTTGEAVLPVIVTGDGSPGTSEAFHVRSGEERHFELRPAVSPTHNVMASIELGNGGGDLGRISARASDGSVLQVNPQRNGGSGETKIQLPQGTFTLTAMRGNGDMQEEAETRVTVQDHDISGVVLQFSPVPSIPVELIVESSDTSDNALAPTLPQFGLVLESDQQDPERGDAIVRMAPRKDQSYVFITPPGRYRLQGRDTGTWFIKGASYGDSDLLREDLVVVPGAAGTPIRVTVSNATGSLQGTVSLKGNPSAAWIYLVPTGPSAQAVMTLHSGTTGTYTAAHLPPGSYQVVAFERRHSVNYRDPASLAAYSSYVHSLTVNAGDKPTLNLDAVPVTEVTP